MFISWKIRQHALTRFSLVLPFSAGFAILIVLNLFSEIVKCVTEKGLDRNLKYIRSSFGLLYMKYRAMQNANL